VRGAPTTSRISEESWLETPHQYNQHYHQLLKHKTWTANQSTKNLSQATKDQIKNLIIQTVKKEKPETAKQLISLIQQTQDLPEKEITKLLIELENENKLHFTKKETLYPRCPKPTFYQKRQHGTGS
jgi:2-oxo-4-hydroxy-4-carboxy--5-ureidoimidazoline (OHCU) decarboxylase